MRLILFVVGLFCLHCLATPQIINVTARQVKPWPGLVEILYELKDIRIPIQDALCCRTRIICEDRLKGTNYLASTFTSQPTYEEGHHRLIWNAKADGVEFASTNCVFKIDIEVQRTYCVVELSGGTSATSYPVYYLYDVPNGGWTDEYKTSKLVLRYIEPGTFTMGDQVHGGNVYTNIQLTTGFYIGVFEVTQRQWELVMGDRPSYFTNNIYYATRPIESVSYDMIRGSSLGVQWPASDTVDATSFLGKLRERTGFNFDLPTEAQWEYACRAGTKTDYNNGTNYSLANMANVGRFYYNCGSGSNSSSSTSQGTATVGSYVPNAWGIYDMHGNVFEWCRDWYGDLSSNRIDPKGSPSGSSRVGRGGAWGYDGHECSSTSRGFNTSSDRCGDLGFRLSWTLSK